VCRKLENSRFEIRYSVLAPSGGVWKNLNIGAQLLIIPYKMPPKQFLKIARLNRLSVITNVGPTVRFWYYRYELDSFAHLQYMGYKAVVEVFFQITSRWSKWCAQTLHPFSQIMKIFSGIPVRVVAPTSNDFQICSFH